MLIGDFDQHADFIVGVPGRAFQCSGLDTARIAPAELTDHPHQWFGQHHIEQRQEDAGQEQAAGEAVEQSDFGPAQKAAAERIGVDLKFEGAQRFVGQMIQIQAIFEPALGPEQVVTDDPIAALQLRAFDAGEHRIVVVGQLRRNDCR